MSQFELLEPPHNEMLLKKVSKRKA